MCHHWMWLIALYRILYVVVNTGLRSATKQWRGDYVEVEVRYGGVKDDARQVCTLSLQCV
jgi:hypothetical protein